MNDRLDDIRLRTENFFQEIGREYYLLRSGLKARLNVDLLAWFAKKKIGASIPDLKRHDLAFLAHTKDFDAQFPFREFRSRMFASFERMDLDPTGHGAIHVDLDYRQWKSPDAFCFAVRVPEEVYVVINPESVSHGELRRGLVLEPADWGVFQRSLALWPETHRGGAGPSAGLPNVDLGFCC